METNNDILKLGAKKLHSRLILGTGKYLNLQSMQQCHQISQTEMVTVALRRVPLHDMSTKSNILNYIDTQKIILLANTAGVASAEEALRLVRIACSMKLNFIKLEVIAESKTLLPDPIETYKAVKLIREHYTKDELFVMVYTNDDPILALKLYNAGADCLMPGGSPIGSGRGIQNIYNMRMILELLPEDVPIILDAGIGSPADAVLAMEMGFDAVLLNSAIAQAQDPHNMALAMYHAVQAGRLSYLSGRMGKKLYATASSPELDI